MITMIMSILKKINLLIKDFFRYLYFLVNKGGFYKIFFLENENTYPYLAEIIKRNISRKKRILIFSQDKNIKIKISLNLPILILETNFFSEIFFLTLKAKYLISTTTDLDTSTIFKKTLNKKCRYIYIQHSHIGLINGYREKAFINFDAVQIINKYQYEDIREINEKYFKKIKRFKSSYYFIKFQKKQITYKDKRNILIAPTWGTDFYENNLHIDICNYLINKNYNITFRPHPMTIKKNKYFLNELEKLKIQIDKSPIIYLGNFNNLISDWSGIIFEFYLIHNKKSFCINTSKKINNSKYEEFKSKPIEFDLRNDVSINYEINNWQEIFNDLDKANNNYNDNDIKKNFY